MAKRVLKNKSRIKNIKNSRKTRKIKKKYSRKMRNKDYTLEDFITCENGTPLLRLRACQ
jgi:hypothetical protein